MTRSTRKKAKRHLISACISGIFSDREISEIATALVEDRGFAADLGRALQRIAREIEEDRPIRGSAREPAQESYPLITRNIFHMIGRLGVTQRELLSIMHDVSPELGATLESKRLSTLELVDRFVQSAGNEQVEMFHDLLKHRLERSPAKGDSYLDIISKKIRDE